MSKRFVVVGGATAVAVLVLAASILFGPDAIKPTAPQGSGNFKPPEVGTPGGNGNTEGSGGGLDITNVEVDDDGNIRRTRIRAKTFSYKPLGVTALLKPRADIYLGPQRAITITADQADMIMENDQPRAGTFSGNVVVTLFEAPTGIKLITEPTNPGHTNFIQQRIFLDDKTDFSIEEDSIKTDGPVHATSPQVDFFGIGLNLSYNTQQKRIERLDIAQGRYLMYNPDAPSSTFTEVAADTPNADAVRPTGTEASGTESDRPSNAPSQFYAATFADNVVVREGLETELGGDRLTLDFSLGSEAVSLEPDEPPTDGSSRSPLPSFLLASQTRLAQANSTPNAPLPVVAIPGKNKQRSLFTHDPKRDIVVTWTGEMQVQPHNTKPDILADEDDVRVTLVGENAYAQTTRNGELERLETSRLEHVRSLERTTAFAKSSGPARILSKALGGELTGQRITLLQQESTANVLGPGLLTYTDPNDNKTLTLHWKNRLDLDLYTQTRTKETLNADAEQSEASDTQSATPTRTRILGVKTATFDTGVTATHPDFDLAADKLSITFRKPDEAKKIDNGPTAINAVGQVEVFAQGDADDERFNIKAQRLSIDLKTTAERETYASSIRAVESVDVRRPGSVLTCDRVDVELNPPTNKQANANTAPNADAEQSETSGTQPNRNAEVRSILSVGNVRARLKNEDRHVNLVADSLFAEVDKDKLTLASNTTKELAEVFDIDKQQKITGQVIVMDDQAQTLDITGPGSLATSIADPNAPKASVEDAFLAISWSDSLSFDDNTGKAEFFGNVRSESRRSIDASEMTCDKLIMQLSADEKDKDREVRSAIATGKKVRFTAAAWEDPANPKDVSNRTILEGPRMVFTNKPGIGVGNAPTETLFVDGKGLMLIEDYRPPDEGDKDDSVFVTGRGASLFSWEKSMLLNAFTNTATLTQRVQMVHRPMDANGKISDVVTLNGQKLVADLIDTGGLSVWLSDEAPDAQFSVITVDGGVRLKNTGRAMTGDHLKYVAKDDRVTVWTEPGRDVLLEDLKRGNETRTNKVTWELEKDRIEIDELRGGTAPLN